MRKKILLIFTLLLIFTVSLSLDSYTYTDDDLVYTWEDTTITVNGLTLDIDSSTQIWQLSGTMTSTQAMMSFTQSLYTANDESSSLSDVEDYIIQYKNITSVSMDADVIKLTYNSNTNAVNGYASQTIYQDEVLNDNYVVMNSDMTPSNPVINTYGAVGDVIDISFYMNIYDYDTHTINDVNIFDTNMTTTVGSLDITITEFNTITLNGNSSSSEASINLTSYLTDLDSNKNYLVKYEYVSGTMTDSVGQKIRPIKINDINTLVLSEANMTTFAAYSTPVITALTIEPYISGNVSYTDFVYKILLEEIGAVEAVETVGYTVFIDDYTSTGSGLTMSISDGNKITIDGTTTSADILWDLSGHLNDADPVTASNYILSYEYVSGTITSTDDAASVFNFLFFIDDTESYDASLFNATQYDNDKNYRVSGSDFLSLAVQLSGAISETITFDNLVYTYTLVEATEEVDATVNYYIDASIDSTVVSTVGASITAPSIPVLADHIFIGWYLEDTFTTLYDFNSDVVGSAVFNLYAKFVADTSDVYTISFDSNDGSLIDDRLVISGEAITAPTAPTRTGYTFNGWYSDEALTTIYDFESLVSADATLYAKWTASSISTPTAPSDGFSIYQIMFFGVGVAILSYLIFKGSKK
ncbi:MAG: InlB B-repeat-containing protein [Acholeplasmataceae bacterium]|nr:InlB B-repeat-containing protein [Acholeplasmataceae bacterium]MCD4826554.1 InlB B-repeat-containing protein [Acholeplasmataceae bacterium]